MILPLFLLVGIDFVFSTVCTNGQDYFHSGDCLEPVSTLRDRLAAERHCRNNGGILYYPYNKFIENQIIELAKDKFPGQKSVWIGITCTDKTICYNDKGQKLTIAINSANYSNFFDPPVKEPCSYLDINSGLWFGDACRGIFQRPSICWYSQNKTDPTCLPGQFFYKNRCYALHGSADPQVVSDHCHNEGGELVSIHTEIENDYVFYLASAAVPVTGTYGIGMYINPDGNKIWYDGSNTAFTHFDPNPGPDNCPYPLANSSVYVNPSTKFWCGDSARKAIPQICTWPAWTNGITKELTTYPNYCTAGKLPLKSIIYSPSYPDYSYAANCTLVYSEGFAGQIIEIFFSELYIGTRTQILIYDSPQNNNPQTISYNSPITKAYYTVTGYMKLQLNTPQSPGVDYSYWMATTSIQGGRLFPLAFPKPFVCDPTKVLHLRASATVSQFQSKNYGGSGMFDECQITISAVTINNTVSVSFYDFYISEADKVIVIDGQLDKDGPLIMTLSGRQPGRRIESTGQFLSFRISGVTANYRGVWADFISN